MGTLGTGNKIGNYLICEKIGSGAMGRVWRGIDEALGRAVAIKMLRTELSDHPELIDRFRVEARALGRLNHPNIATVFALVEENDELYLVMEYLPGETLHARLERRGALAVAECFPLFHHALDGIQHAHDAGVVHRDIKASNLMLDQGGQAKWIDFGIARLDGHKGSTRTGGLMGTPEYMAPEQVRGEAGTVQSDVYSLGVLLYKLLTGRSPFSGKGEFDVMRAHVESAPPPPRELGVAVNEDLEAVLLRALAKDPTDRFSSASAFQDALVEAGAPKPVRATPPPVPESEATLYDASPPPPEPTQPVLSAYPWEEDGIAGTVPGLDLDEGQRSVDRDAPTRLDPAPRSGRSRLAVWIGVAIVAAGAAVALDWIATSYRTGSDAPPAASESAPADAGGNVEGGADRGTQPEGSARDPAAAGPEPSDAARKSPGSPGWEIVR